MSKNITDISCSDPHPVYFRQYYFSPHSFTHQCVPPHPPQAQKEYRRVIRIPLSRSSSSAGTQSTLTKRINVNSHSNSHNHTNGHANGLKQSFNRGTYQTPLSTINTTFPASTPPPRTTMPASEDNDIISPTIASASVTVAVPEEATNTPTTTTSTTQVTTAPTAAPTTESGAIASRPTATCTTTSETEMGVEMDVENHTTTTTGPMTTAETTATTPLTAEATDAKMSTESETEAAEEPVEATSDSTELITPNIITVDDDIV